MPEVAAPPEARPREVSAPPTHPIPDRPESAYSAGRWILDRIRGGQSARQEAAAPIKPETPPQASAPVPEDPTEKFAVANPDIVRQMHGTGESGTGLPMGLDHVMNPDLRDKPDIPHRTMSDNSTFAIGGEPGAPKSKENVPVVAETAKPDRVPWSGFHSRIIRDPREDTTGGAMSFDGSKVDPTRVPEGSYGVLKPTAEQAARMKEKYGTFYLQKDSDGNLKRDKDGKLVVLDSEQMAAQRLQAVKDVVDKTKYGVGVTIVVAGLGVGITFGGGEGVGHGAPYEAMPHAGGTDTELVVPSQQDQSPGGRSIAVESPGGIAVGQEKGSNQSESSKTTPEARAHFSWNAGDQRDEGGLRSAQEAIAIALAKGDDVALTEMGLKAEDILALKDGKPLAKELDLSKDEVRTAVAKVLDAQKKTPEGQAVLDKVDHDVQAKMDQFNGPGHADAAGQSLHANIDMPTVRAIADDLAQIQREQSQEKVGAS